MKQIFENAVGTNVTASASAGTASYTLSYWHNSEDVAKLNDIVLLFASAHECTCLRSPGGNFTADDGKLCFYYTADAEIY